MKKLKLNVVADIVNCDDDCDDYDYDYDDYDDEENNDYDYSYDDIVTESDVVEQIEQYSENIEDNVRNNKYVINIEKIDFNCFIVIVDTDDENIDEIICDITQDLTSFLQGTYLGDFMVVDLVKVD